MKKFFVILFAIFIIGIGYLCFQKNNKVEIASDKPVLKIGVSLPLTGNLAYAGLGMKASLEVFMDELNKKSLKNNYKFIFEDNAWDMKKAAFITNKFISIDKVDAIIDFGSTIGAVSSPLSKRDKVLHFNACASDGSVADGEYNFLQTTLPSDEVKLLVSKIKGNYENIVIFGQNDVSSVVTVDMLAKELGKEGISFVSYFVNPMEKDMRSVIAKSKNHGADLYIVILYSPTLEIFAKQFKEAGLDTPMMSTHFFANITDYNLIEEAKFADYAVMDGKLKKKIMDKTPGSNYEMCIGYIYDIADILINAFENDKDIAVNNIRKIKERNGMVGYMTQNNKGVFSVKPSYKMVRNGELVVIEE